MDMKPILSTLIVCASLLAAATGLKAQDNTTRFTAQDGSQVTLTSGQPAPGHYGPAPTFEQLDTDHDGSISREEASVYLPLFNDFDHLAHHTDRISKHQFDNWNRTQNR
jgi:hypothetical protein